LFVFKDKIEFENRKNDCLTIGELLVDLIASDEHDDANTYQQFFGGSPANIAMNMKRLGASPLIASSVGRDRLGDYLINHMAQNGICTKLIQRVECPTSLVLLNKSTGTPLPIFYRNADYQLIYSEALEQEIIASKIIHFSCWSISRYPARSTVEKAIQVARNNNVLVCFDPNYHQMLWQNGENGPQYIKDIIGQVDIIKPSEDDAERIFGQDTPANQIDKFLNLGAKLVILTLGKDGLIVSNGNKSLKFESLATEVADTTGAGDAFWSGFYTAIIKGYPIIDAVALGSTTSAYKLKHVGAVVNLPRLENLKDIYSL